MGVWILPPLELHSWNHSRGVPVHTPTPPQVCPQAREEPTLPPSQPTDADRSSRDIVELLQQLGSHMHGIGTRFAARESLHATDVQALSALAMAGGHLGAGELARSLELSSGATTRLIDRLERVGHVERSTDPQDRRRRVVAITSSAQSTAGEFFGSLADTIERVLAPYSHGEREVLRRFLADIVSAMEEHRRA